MTITTAWHNNEQHILVSGYESPITIDEIIASQDEVLERLDSLDHDIYQIVDLSKVAKIPDRVLINFPKLAEHPATRHPRTQMLVCVTPNPIANHLAGIFQRIFGGMRIANSMDEALDIIQQVDGRG